MADPCGKALEALARWRSGDCDPEAVVQALDDVLRAVAERDVALANRYDACFDRPNGRKQMDRRVIRAEVHSDDRVYEVEFDALKWFEEAEDEEIMALANIDWGGNYAADAVAEALRDGIEDIDRLFDYLSRIAHTRRSCGFECHVDGRDALDWLARNRSALHARLMVRRGAPADAR